MKKIKLIILLNIFFYVGITQAQETCANGNGTIFIHSDGTRYCQSNFRMNWYNAHSWCQGIGMQLVTLDECKINNPDFYIKRCARFSGKPAFWTQDVSSSEKAYYVIAPHNGIDTRSRMDTTYSGAVPITAMCK